MDQPDANTNYTQIDALVKDDTNNMVESVPEEREWFPEDEDEWYEPDYRKPERYC